MERVVGVFVGLLVLASGGVSQAQQPAARGPNVVLIMSDDMGYADLGVYGSRDIRTPNIDGLGRDGAMMTDFYSNGTLCSPTRAGLITGRYQQRYEIETALQAATQAGGDRGLLAQGRSLPRLLKNNGYATALVGKWHLGHKPEFSPNAHGFDYFFGFKSGYIDFYQHTDGTGSPDFFENETPIKQNGYMTDLITARSIEFIQRNASRPFFIDVAYNAPHWPYQVPDHPTVAEGNARHLQPHSDNTSTRADYVAMLERVDKGVGEILATLDRLGLAGNTIVIFTNDNGGEWLASNGPLFNRKQTVWEGGIRVPALIRWPGRIRPGTVSDQVGITMDLTASILAATNSSVPAEARHEGINLFPILEGRTPEVSRTLFWRVLGKNQRAVRSGDWKLVVDANNIFLFNLRTDIAERNDMANKRQDVAHALRPQLAAWEADVDREANPTGVQFGGRSGRSGGPGGGRQGGAGSNLELERP